MPADLPVGVILRGAVAFNRRHAGTLARSFWPQVAAYAAVLAADAAAVRWAQLVFLVIGGVEFFAWVTGWHRFVVRLEPPTPRLGRREAFYLVTAALFGVAVAALYLIALMTAFSVTSLAGTSPLRSLLATLALVPAAGLAVWLAAPMLLTLPALALDQPLSLTRAGSLLGANRWRFVVIMIAIPLMLSLAEAVAALLPPPVGIAVEIIGLLSYPVEVAALSLSYIWLSEEQPPTTVTERAP